MSILVSQFCSSADGQRRSALAKCNTRHTAVDKFRIWRILWGGGYCPVTSKALVELMLTSDWHVTLRFFLLFSRYSRSNGQNLGAEFRIWGNPWGHRPKRRENLSGTDVYHRAQFHADRCHRRRDICNRTEKKQQTYYLAMAGFIRLLTSSQ